MLAKCCCFSQLRNYTSASLLSCSSINYTEHPSSIYIQSAFSSKYFSLSFPTSTGISSTPQLFSSDAEGMCVHSFPLHDSTGPHRANSSIYASAKGTWQVSPLSQHICKRPLLGRSIIYTQVHPVIMPHGTEALNKEL